MSAQNILDSMEKFLSYLHPLRNEVIKEIETGKIMPQANIIGQKGYYRIRISKVL